MNIIKPMVYVEDFDANKIKKNIEKAIRVCYKSEDKITDTSADDIIAKIIDDGFESTLEHEKITVRFIVDRGVSHEIVRHRIASFSQESTRYVNYSKGKYGSEITVIEPFFWNDSNKYKLWYDTCLVCEKAYMDLLAAGAKPQEARSVLPNSLKTEVVTTFNIREWRHFFRLRCANKAHPQMRQVTLPLYNYFMVNGLWIFFKDIKEVDKEFNRSFYGKIEKI
jgi:thymidylate synthase (FAD)